MIQPDEAQASKVPASHFIYVMAVAPAREACIEILCHKYRAALVRAAITSATRVPEQ